MAIDFISGTLGVEANCEQSKRQRDALTVFDPQRFLPDGAVRPALGETLVMRAPPEHGPSAPARGLRDLSPYSRARLDDTMISGIKRTDGSALLGEKGSTNGGS